MDTLELQSGQTYNLPPGSVYGPKTYSDLQDVTISAATIGDAKIVGDAHRNSVDDLFWIMSSQRVTIRRIDLSFMWRCLRMADCEDATVEGCHFSKARQEGFIDGLSKRLHMLDCLSEHNGPKWGPPGTGDSGHEDTATDHAFYALSDGAQDALLQRNVGLYSTGTAIHGTPNEDAGTLGSGHTIEDFIGAWCGSLGTGGGQFDGITRTILRRALFAHNRAGIAWFNDYQQKFACTDWTIEYLTLYNPNGVFNFHFAANSARFTIAHSILWPNDDYALCIGADGDGENKKVKFGYPAITDSLIITARTDLPAGVVANNTIWTPDMAAALFPRAALLDFTPSDPGITQGFRPWWSGKAPWPGLPANGTLPSPTPAPPPQPPPTPSPAPSPTSDAEARLTAVLNALDAVDGRARALSADRFRQAELLKQLSSEQGVAEKDIVALQAAVEAVRKAGGK